jgi:hypothetical protein
MPLCRLACVCMLRAGAGGIVPAQAQKEASCPVAGSAQLVWTCAAGFFAAFLTLLVAARLRSRKASTSVVAAGCCTVDSRSTWFSFR